MIEVRDIFKESKKYFNTEVSVYGWVKTIRSSKNFGFIEINDGTFFKGVQVVFTDELKNFNEVEKLGVGTSLSIKGILIETPDNKQPFEIKAKEILVLGESSSEYPLQKKRHTFEYLRTIAHLRPRTNTFSAVFRVRSLAYYAIHQFFNERNFVYVHTPIITGSDCEGAGEIFKITTLDLDNLPKTDDSKTDQSKDFFGKEVGLTVSGQLSGETYAQAFKKIYTFGPTFRAENSNTTRHAAEFWMLEPEIAFADLQDNMDLAEDLLKYIISYILKNAPEEIAFFNQFIEKGLSDKLENILNNKFEKITYTEAITILEKSGEKFEYPVKWGIDLQTEHEKYLTDQVYKKPVFVTDYPKDQKAFYMRINEDNKTVAAMDLLVPGIGEMIGGSQREERYDILVKRMEELNLKQDDYWWYLDLRKFGTTKHSGFGLGFERLIMYITGMTNIRDVIPFPRTAKNIQF